MPSYGDQVSVFHFTNRISSAKIRKYKMATERGMNNGPGQRPSSNTPVPGPVITPAPQVEPAGHMTSMGPPPAPSPQEEPPAKKPKLKLTVRNPDASPAPAPSSASMPAPAPSPAPVGDTITVSRPRRNSGLRIRYSENMVLEDESLRRATPDSSDLSSLGDTPPPGKEKQKTPNSANPDYGDFMSYYILDGDDDKPKAAKAKPPPKSRQQGPSQPQYQQHAQQQQQMQAARDAGFKHHGPQPQQYPPAQYRPPPPPPPPLPQVQLIDFDHFFRTDRPTEPETVLQMVKKLEALSTALTNFGGVPAVPKSPKEQQKTPAVQAEKTKDNALDSFLGMFDDDDDEGDGEDKPSKDDAQKKLDYRLPSPGESDGPLTYGIQFIQNALKSWAQQRLQHQFAAQLQQQAQEWQRQQLQQQKRGPGRPRKFQDDGEPERAPPPTQPPPLQIRAESTPEGMAIKAFQHVLESGCLQVNAMLPQELTGALRHLYMQIDHLINQGAKSEPQWQCMSYGAQIAANKVRVDKWKDAQAKAAEEMARQQQLAQQQMMQQMGLQTQQPGQQNAAQTQHAHAVELERRRSVQHATQQPYLSQHHLNPLALGSQPPGTPSGIVPSQSPANAHGSGSRAPTPNGVAATPNGEQGQSSPASGSAQQHMGKVKMYVPGFMPRTGAQMKFSFAPNNDQAVKLFGTQAFPNGAPQGPNIPNRGPMSGTPGPAPQSPIMGLDGAADSPIVRPSIEDDASQANGEAHETNGQVVEDGEKGEEGEDEDVEMVEAEPVLVKKEAPTPVVAQTGGFTAVNAPQRPITVPASSPVEATPNEAAEGLGSSAATVSKMNGQGGSSDMASRFPHPGAVVVDQ